VSPVRPTYASARSPALISTMCNRSPAKHYAVECDFERLQRQPKRINGQIL
jgi:hypothetical protein